MAFFTWLAFSSLNGWASSEVSPEQNQDVVYFLCDNGQMSEVTIKYESSESKNISTITFRTNDFAGKPMTFNEPLELNFHYGDDANPSYSVQLTFEEDHFFQNEILKLEVSLPKIQNKPIKMVSSLLKGLRRKLTSDQQAESEDNKLNLVCSKNFNEDFFTD